MRLSVCPQPSFADFELQQQGLAVDAILQEIGHVLEQQAALLELVR